MTIPEVKAVLDSTGIPVAYNSFPNDSVPGLPWLVFLETGTSNFAADGIVHYSARNITIEFYAEQKDFESEALIESALSEAGIYWTKDEGVIAFERMYQTLYRIEV